nr:uncharacterized proline-rich protein-like [Lytechinus pictus]
MEMGTKGPSPPPTDHPPPPTDHPPPPTDHPPPPTDHPPPPTDHPPPPTDHPPDDLNRVNEAQRCIQITPPTNHLRVEMEIGTKGPSPL